MTFRYVREQENRDRDILLSTNFTTNTEMSITIDDAAITHHSRLGNAHKEIDDIIDVSVDVEVIDIVAIVVVEVIEIVVVVAEI